LLEPSSPAVSFVDSTFASPLYLVAASTIRVSLRCDGVLPSDTVMYVNVKHCIPEEPVRFPVAQDMWEATSKRIVQRFTVPVASTCTAAAPPPQ
jgi:hypothetical protein